MADNSMMEPDPLIDLCTDAHCFDAQFHPQENLLLAATITGKLHLYRYDVDLDAGTGETELVRTIEHHKESCRRARFFPGGAGTEPGTHLVSTAANGFTYQSDVETGKRLWRCKLPAGGSALLPLSSNKFAVGDDDGRVAIYDVRQKKAAVEWLEHSDFVSDLAFGTDRRSLCSVSGEGMLGVYDIRYAGEQGLVAMSDFLEDEYSCMQIMQHGSQVVCGGQMGVLAVFKWGDFGDMKDRIPVVKKTPIDALVKFGEDCCIVGTDDGKIRVVSVYHETHENWFLGILAEHGSNPIEQLALSPDQSIIASVSHGQPDIRVFPTALATRMLKAKKDTTGDACNPGGKVSGENSDSDSDEPKAKRRKKGRKRVRTSDDQRRAASFFSGL